ncbi:MAG: dihydrofolate reductase family protein [Chloroflexi bacterium]|nr:dihydrofolate reductase family protein [Chloroflexota bacterium]
MGKLIVSMNLSLDGYISAEGEDDGSWLHIDEEVHTAFNELALGADAFLYGRNVYEVMIPYWPDAAEDTEKPAYERDYGRIWCAKPKIVVSTTIKEAGWNTRVVSADVFDEIARLKRDTKGYILCYGGAELVAALHEQGLVDEYALFIHPSTLGAGVPFFRARADLTLLDMRRFKQGVLELRYANLAAVATEKGRD